MLAIVRGRRAQPVVPRRRDREAPGRGDHRAPAGRGQPGARVRSMRSLELLYGRLHPVRPAGQGHGARRRADRRGPTWSRSTRQRIRPVALSLAIVGDVRPEHALDRAAAELDGWTAPPAEPGDRRRATAGLARRQRIDRDAGEVPDRHRLRLHHDQPARSALLRLLDDEQRPRAVRPRRPARRQHPRAAGDGVLRVQHARSGGRRGPLLVRAGVDPANVERAIAAIDHEVATLGADGPTATELAETRAYLVGSIPRLLETNQSIAAFLQTCGAVRPRPRLRSAAAGAARAVTLEEIRAAAAEVLRSRARGGRGGRARSPDAVRRAMSPAAPTRAVFFDVDFTLIHPGPTFQGPGYRDFCARHGVTVDPAAFDAAVASAAALTLEREGGIYDPQIFIDYTRQIIEGMGGAGDARRSRRPRHLRRVVGLPPLLALRGRARGAARSSTPRAEHRADLEHPALPGVVPDRTSRSRGCSPSRSRRRITAT